MMQGDDLQRYIRNIVFNRHCVKILAVYGVAKRRHIIAVTVMMDRIVQPFDVVRIIPWLDW